MNTKKIISIFAASTIITSVGLNTVAVKTENTSISSAALSYENPELAEYAKQVAILVNRERLSKGLQPVKFSPLLSEAANARSSELRKSFSHTRPDGTSCFTVLKEFDISYVSAAENIAYGQRTPEIVMDAWMNSSGHRANILNKNMKYIGVGVVYNNGIYYWTQLFAASDTLSDAYLPDENNGIPNVTTTEITISTTTTTTVTISTTKSTTANKTTTKVTTNNVKTTSTKPLTSTSQTTVTNKTTSHCPESTTNSVVTCNPTFTLPDLNDYINSYNENIILSPEKIDIYDFLFNSDVSKDKYSKNSKENFTEIYNVLKSKIFNKIRNKNS